MAGNANGDDDDIDLREKYAKQIEEIRSEKRKRARENNDYCCTVCKVTKGWKNKNNNLVDMKDEDGDGEDVGVGDPVVVDLHTTHMQVVMTLNAPTGFNLSLDFLPCFQPPVPRPVSETETANQPPVTGFKGKGFKGKGKRGGSGWIASGSSSGLLLCTSAQNQQCEYYICNPLTKQWMVLPPAPRQHYYVHVGFIVEPCRNFKSHQHLHPLCIHCKFQVVRFHDEYQCHQMHPRTKYEAEIYSSTSGQWTIETVESLREMRWAGDNFPSIFHNGRLHWPAADASTVVYDPYQKKLIGVIDPPSQRQTCQNSMMGGISLSAGSFWIGQFSDLSLDLRFWKLKGYDTQTDNLDACYWRPMYKFSITYLTGGPKWGPKHYGCSILGMHPYDPTIVYFRLRRRHHEHGVDAGSSFIVDCNLRTKTLGQPKLRNLPLLRYMHVLGPCFSG